MNKPLSAKAFSNEMLFLKSLPRRYGGGGPRQRW